MGHQRIKGLLCPALGMPYVRSTPTMAELRAQGQTAPFNVTLTRIPDRDLAAPGVALGEQCGGSSPPAKVPLCSARFMLA